MNLVAWNPVFPKPIVHVSLPHSSAHPKWSVGSRHEVSHYSPWLQTPTSHSFTRWHFCLLWGHTGLPPQAQRYYLVCFRSTWNPQPRHFLQPVWKWTFVCLACPLCLEASDFSLTLLESLCKSLGWYLFFFLFLCPKGLHPPSHLMWDRRDSGVQPEAGPQIRHFEKYALWENEVHWADTPRSVSPKQLRKRRQMSLFCPLKSG